MEPQNGAKGPPTVRLDGNAARRIREEKGLTQLYVAEVVGVSADTVSRWENNRTASVRRDNAEALARALEVPVDALLGATDPARPGPARRRWRPWAVAAMLVALAAALWWGLGPAGAPVHAVRRLPPYTPPGTEVPVLVRLGTGTGRVVVRETLPEGWRLVRAVPQPDRPPGDDGVIKWIVDVPERGARVAYLVRAPYAEEGTAYWFRGVVVGPGRRAAPRPVGGEDRIDLEFVHWADEDGDFQIGDAEVLDALERLETAGDLGLDPVDLRRLWGAPEYAWDPATRQFHPVAP